jgi:hypothetical protein
VFYALCVYTHIVCVHTLCVRACVRVCVCVRACVCVYTHTHIDSLSLSLSTHTHKHTFITSGSHALSLPPLPLSRCLPLSLPGILADEMGLGKTIQVSFAYVLGLFCLHTRSLLTLVAGIRYRIDRMCSLYRQRMCSLTRGCM